MSEIEIVCLRLLLENFLNKAKSRDAAIYARKLLAFMEGLSSADLVDGNPPVYDESLN